MAELSLIQFVVDKGPWALAVILIVWVIRSTDKREERFTQERSMYFKQISDIAEKSTAAIENSKEGIKTLLIALTEVEKRIINEIKEIK
jgi:hypothetical protein